MEWSRSMPPTERSKIWAVLAACSHETSETVASSIRALKDSRTTQAERQHALTTIADALFVKTDDRERPHTPDGSHRVQPPTIAVHDTETQQSMFAERLRAIMESKCLSQQELAERVGCSQPAISQMLNRRCRPQKKTILKLAEALGVKPADLWPDIAMVEMLDAVASFQEDDYVMTEAEARALSDPSNRKLPTMPFRSLPARPRSAAPEAAGE